MMIDDYAEEDFLIEPEEKKPEPKAVTSNSTTGTLNTNMDDFEEEFVTTITKAGKHLALIGNAEHDLYDVDGMGDVDNLRVAASMLKHATMLLRQMNPMDQDEKHRHLSCVHQHRALCQETRLRVQDMTRHKSGNRILNYMRKIDASDYAKLDNISEMARSYLEEGQFQMEQHHSSLSGLTGQVKMQRECW